MLTEKKLKIEYHKEKDTSRYEAIIRNSLSLDCYNLGIYPDLDKARKNAPKRLQDWIKYPPCKAFEEFTSTYTSEY